VSQHDDENRKRSFNDRITGLKFINAVSASEKLKPEQVPSGAESGA
jgi:hypothetical protein